MKKIITLLLACSVMFSCFGCAEKKTEEEKFVDTLAKGIEARFELEKTSSSEEKLSKEDFLKQVNAEYDKVKKFEEVTFDNQDLNKWKKQYLQSLSAVNDILEIYNTNQWYAKYDNGIDYKRIEALYHINEIQKVPVSETYKEQFDSMLVLKTVDERFLECLANGLESRWELTDADEKKEVITKKDWEEYIAAEYDNIIDFKDAEFENPDLGKWGKEYINSIVRSKEVLAYYDSNQWYAKYHNDVYQDRACALYKINAIQPVPVTEEEQGELQSLVMDGEVSDFASLLLGSVKFELESDDYGWKTYSAVVENTTSTSFSTFQIAVDLLDKDGVTIETAIAYCDGWDSGEKTRIEFNTDKSFETINNSYASWGF